MLKLGTTTLLQIQKQFNNLFPYLKLEFLPHASHARIGRHTQSYSDDKYLSKVLNKKIKGLVINEHMSVSTAEQLLLQEYGIATQVLRKSGNAWLETSLTHDWTLKRQNDEGHELSTLQHIKKIER